MIFHCFQELICTALALFGIFKLYPIYKHQLKRDNINLDNLIIDFRASNSLFWLLMFFFILGTTTTFHGIVSTFYPQNNSIFIPFTYLPERIGDSVFILLSVLSPYYNINKLKAIFICSLAYLAIVLFVMYVDFTSIVSSGSIIGRPQEMLQILFALVVTSRLWTYKNTNNKILKWSTLSTLCGGVVMLFSLTLFDVAFVVAHWFKIVSYYLVMISVLNITHWYNLDKGKV